MFPKKFVILGLILILLLAGCAVIPPQPEVATRSPAATDTPAGISAEEDPTATAVVGPGNASLLRLLTDLQSLPPGQYVSFYRLSTGTPEAVSFQGKTYPVAELTPDFVFSENTAFALGGSTLFDLRGHAELSVPAESGCATLTISKDGDLLIGMCEDGGLVRRSPESNWEPVFDAEDGFSDFSAVLISDRERRLAFCMQDPEKEETHQAAYFIETRSCLQADICDPVKLTADCAGGLMDFSPDGNHYVFVDGAKIFQINLLQNERSILWEEESERFEGGLAFSPDGQWIVLQTNGSGEEADERYLELLPAIGGEPSRLYGERNEMRLIGWLNVITPFAEGRSYLVLPSERPHWLKATPGESGVNVTRLAPNDWVKVLDERATVDGENWWRVLADGDVGWVKESADLFQDDWRVDLRSPEFEVGNHLVVSQAGSGLRLREAPSLDGKVKRRLQPGIGLVILDGPARVDNYRWWFVELDDSGLQGWVVEEPRWYGSDSE